MARDTTKQMDEIVSLLGNNPEGLARGQIADKLTFTINNKTLQRRLSSLAREGRITKSGNKSAIKYYPVNVPIGEIRGQNEHAGREMSGKESEDELSFLNSLITQTQPNLFKRDRRTPERNKYVPNLPGSLADLACQDSHERQEKASEDAFIERGMNGPDYSGLPTNSAHQDWLARNRDTLNFLNAPLYAREKVPYKREFVEEYVPGETSYVPEEARQMLLEQGKRFDKELAAGTYARRICQRLLIDLSYNSSRLEGNTYSKLDTEKLVEEGMPAEGKAHEETVMIVNHKEAILFLVENAREVQLNSFTICNLHNLLSQDLIASPKARGNTRTIEVDIGGSAYRPVGDPHILRELFELILLKARKIADPFEQSFFLLIHLSYLQAFADVNKRTSRLSCNIPFIKQNLCPLSFVDVPRDCYTTALLAIYERNEISPMLDLFYWAYVRSCEQYGVVQESLGELDAFRIQYRQQRKEVMGLVIRKGLQGEAIREFIEGFCSDEKIPETDKFTAMTLADLNALHAGAIIGLGISEAQLDSWLESRPFSPG